MTVTRAGQPVWHDATNTARLHRSVQSLVDWLFLESDFPAGVVLSTGTGLVPEMDFTLQPRDVITIVIDQVGSLNNVVVAGKQAVAR